MNLAIQPEITTADLPPEILLGTSSWVYEGWRGIIYTRSYRSEKAFRENALAEYAENQWFRTVGIDHSFYTPLISSTLERYCAQVPHDFRWISKVWEEITVPHYGKHPRYGQRAGKPNPNFLDAALMQDRVLEPLQHSLVRPHVGPLVFQFQAFPQREVRKPEWFLEKLAAFFDRLPRDFQYAVEIRNPEIFESPHYIEVLNEFEISHCFNHWTGMPSLKRQMEILAAGGGLRAPFYVARLLTPLGVTYEDAVKLHAPYREVKTPQIAARNDATRIALRALQRQVPAFIIANNRFEGHAPGTIQAIVRQIQEQRNRGRS